MTDSNRCRPARAMHALVASIALLSVTSSQGALWIVDDDGGPGITHSEIQSAIDTASDGDTILVKDGLYGPFNINARALVLVAETGTTPRINGTSTVVGQVAGRTISVRGFEFVTGLTLSGNLHAVNGVGPLWLEDLVNDISPGPSSGWLTDHAVQLVSSRNVVFVGCDFAAGVPTPSWFNEESGVLIDDSSMVAYDSVFRGGDATIRGGRSGHGVKLGDQAYFAPVSAFFSGCKLVGGATLGGASGSGLKAGGIASAPYTCDHVATTFTPGAGGTPGLSIQTSGTGTVTAFPGSARTFHATSPVRGGQFTSLSYTGAPGDMVVVFASNAPAATIGFVPSLVGAPLVAPPWAQLPLGVVPASGQVSVNVPVPLLPPGIGAFTVYTQAIALSGPGSLALGSGSALTVINQIY